MTMEQSIYRQTLAPTLISYTEWVLQEAAERKIKRLYFLARDAYMSYLTAQKLVKVRKLKVECRYLEGSRYAWRMAQYHLLGKASLEKICIGGVSVSLRKLLCRGGLTEAEIMIVASELGREDELDKQLTYEEIRQYKEVLAGDSSFLNFLYVHSRKAYQNAIEYFAQEGLLDEVQYAVVDSGWVGSLQQTLEQLVNTKSGHTKRIEGFYFGLYELPEAADKKLYHTYYFRPYKDIIRKVHFANCLFEAIFTSPDGMTTGYLVENGIMAAKKESETNPNKERILGNLDILDEILKEHCSCIIEGRESPHLLKIGENEKLLSKLMSEPSREEAAALGNYLFSDDVNSGSLQSLAYPLSKENIRNTHVFRRIFLMKGFIHGEIKESAWLEGSIVMEGSNVKVNLWHCRMYKCLIYLRKRIKNII